MKIRNIITWCPWQQHNGALRRGGAWAWGPLPFLANPHRIPLTLHAPDEDLLRRVAERPLSSTVGTGHTEPHGHADR